MIDVPPGTIVRTLDGVLAGQLVEHGQVCIVYYIYIYGFTYVCMWCGIYIYVCVYICVFFVVRGYIHASLTTSQHKPPLTVPQTVLVARGGRGGRGNEAFKSVRNNAPKLMERGEPGGERWLQIELKLVGIVYK